MSITIKTPRIVSNYVNIFRPSGAIYRGPDGRQLRSEQWYDSWVPNDHSFAQGPDGGWHIFGITHPLTSSDNIHEGEVQLFHAEALENVFRHGAAAASFIDKGNILPPSERTGEIKEIHSPCIVRKNDVYHMIYGPSPFRLATSLDLKHWKLNGELFRDADGGRDPQIMHHDNKYYLSYCSGNEVRLRESVDLVQWTNSQTIFVMPKGISPESPFLLFFEEVFYLFICTWDGNWDKQTVSQAYQHKTWVFANSAPDDFASTQPIAAIDAHAPEIFESRGQYFISSAEWPTRGINVASLSFA